MGSTWACEAYGSDGAEVGALCFVAAVRKVAGL
jgi:hypothetical protein